MDILFNKLVKLSKLYMSDDISHFLFRINVRILLCRQHSRQLYIHAKWETVLSHKNPPITETRTNLSKSEKCKKIEISKKANNFVEIDGRAHNHKNSSVPFIANVLKRVVDAFMNFISFIVSFVVLCWATSFGIFKQESVFISGFQIRVSTWNSKQNP